MHRKSVVTGRLRTQHFSVEFSTFELSSHSLRPTLRTFKACAHRTLVNTISSITQEEHNIYFIHYLMKVGALNKIPGI